MRTLVLVSTNLRQRDLVRLCLRSLRRHAPAADLAVILNPETIDATWHARGIEQVRATGRCAAADLVVLFDDDAMVLSEAWLPTMHHAFQDARVGAWGAAGGRGGALHPSCLALRRVCFDAVPTFHADWSQGVDTAGLACRWLGEQGWELRPVVGTATRCGETFGAPPLWRHLGSGTAGWGHPDKKAAFLERRAAYVADGVQALRRRCA